MPCSRCGAMFKEDPSCGKVEHLDLPSRGIPDQDPRQAYPAANPPMVKLAAQILMGEYIHDLWICTGGNPENYDVPQDTESVLHVTSKWGEIYVEGQDRQGESWVLHEDYTDAQIIGGLLHRMMPGMTMIITPELIQELRDEGFLP